MTRIAHQAGCQRRRIYRLYPLGSLTGVGLVSHPGLSKVAAQWRSSRATCGVRCAARVRAVALFLCLGCTLTPSTELCAGVIERRMEDPETRREVADARLLAAKASADATYVERLDHVHVFLRDYQAFGRLR